MKGQLFNFIVIDLRYNGKNWNENAIFSKNKICVIHYDALELIIFILDRIFMFVQVSNFDHKQHDFDHEFLYYIQRSFRYFFNRFENYNEKWFFRSPKKWKNKNIIYRLISMSWGWSISKIFFSLNLDQTYPNMEFSFSKQIKVCSLFEIRTNIYLIFLFI